MLNNYNSGNYYKYLQEQVSNKPKASGPNNKINNIENTLLKNVQQYKINTELSSSYSSLYCSNDNLY
jgi:hypothetical protein